MTKRYRYGASLSWGGDTPTAELEVEVTFSVSWGSPETGRSGRPEDYDCGSPSIVEDIRVETIDGRPPSEQAMHEYVPGETVRMIIDKLEMDHEADMIDSAVQDDDAARDSYLEQAWKDGERD